MIKKTLIGTLFSILIFFSTSFLTILYQLNSPLKRIESAYELRIGFPFEYYHEFWVDCPIPNSGWNVDNLLLDCSLTWGITMLLVIIISRKK